MRPFELIDTPAVRRLALLLSGVAIVALSSRAWSDHLAWPGYGPSPLTLLGLYWGSALFIYLRLVCDFARSRRGYYLTLFGMVCAVALAASGASLAHWLHLSLRH